jgi:hypothetical protein
LSNILFGGHGGGWVQRRERDRRHFPWLIIGIQPGEQALRVDFAIRRHHEQDHPGNHTHANQAEQHRQEHAQQQQTPITLLPCDGLICYQLSHDASAFMLLSLDLNLE